MSSISENRRVLYPAGKGLVGSGECFQADDDKPFIGTFTGKTSSPGILSHSG